MMSAVERQKKSRRPTSLVSVRKAGLRQINYYWTKQEELSITAEELSAAGVDGNDTYLRLEVIEPLKTANKKLKKHGFELIVKDGYRSPELYHLAHRKRTARWGKEATERLLNMERMPHASGLVVDVNLVDLQTGKEVKMRDPKDDDQGAQFIGFYKDRTDVRSQEFERRQDLLIGTMLSVGFELGVKREFWHFELKPVAQQAGSSQLA